jgi:hypothetical protein
MVTKIFGLLLSYDLAQKKPQIHAAFDACLNEPGVTIRF